MVSRMFETFVDTDVANVINIFIFSLTAILPYFCKIEKGAKEVQVGKCGLNDSKMKILIFITLTPGWIRSCDVGSGGGS